MSGFFAILLALAGEPEGGLSIGLAGASASIVLARVELRRARQRVEDIGFELEQLRNEDLPPVLVFPAAVSADPLLRRLSGQREPRWAPEEEPAA